MQKISNPVPRVTHPDWLHKKVREKEDRFHQKKLIDIFSLASKEKSIQKDIEDILSDDKASKVKPKHISYCHQVNSCKSQGKGTGSTRQQRLSSFNQNDKFAENIDRNVDYQGWLDMKKRKWKQTREERKRRRLGSIKMPNQSAGTGDLLCQTLSAKHHKDALGINSFIRRHEMVLLRSYWQIIQLLPSSQSGLFYAWVVADGIMFKVPIDVPRVFYLNSRAPITEEFPGRVVNKILPHGRPCCNLIEVIIDESQFKAQSRKLAAHLADPEVEGIYETKVSLEHNAILELGCVCKVDKTAKHRKLTEKWSLRELYMKTTAECSYLEDVSHVYLYHSFSSGRGVYVLYFPMSGSINVVVINPSQNKELSLSLLDKQFRAACQALSVDSLTVNRVSFKVEYVISFGLAEKLLLKLLAGYRDQHSGPTICLIECPNFLVVTSRLYILSDMPCISIPFNDRDNNYQILGWQTAAGKIGMQRCASSSQWLNERILISRYAHVPVGNFELDWLLFTLDAFFSRALRDQQQVLWMSDDGTPDLGGIVEEDVPFIDEVENPVLIYPGAYRRVTIELKIHHLAVNALMKSNQINEMEGGVLSGFDTDTTTSHAENATFLPAFRVLKQLMGRCISDAVTSGNVFADAILQHFYRWLCSPMSKLHDPALHRLLHKVMKKVFAFLLVEIRKLGATIVFASFSKIIIDTGKSDLPSAIAYCSCLLKTLQSKDLFEWIELEPLHSWHSLLFMDQYNYGGIQTKSINGSSVDSCVLQNESIDDESQVDIVSSWNIAENLPKATQDHFILIVSEFLYIPWKFSRQKAVKSGGHVPEICTPSITVSVAMSFEASLTEFLKDQISNYFTEKLLKIVKDILHHVRDQKREEDNDPQGPSSLKSFSSHRHTGDAALEFIKNVCAVLALDQHVEHDILRMRKNLLKLVRVKEFAPEAQFQDSFPSLTLPNVICSYCNDCRDLDLSHDSSLWEQNWRCAVANCAQPYDRAQMENALLQIVRQRERLYHLQDLVCLRCKQVKAAHLSEQCGCGGSFRCLENVVDFSRKMQVFLNVAKSQKFPLLEDCTSWILEATMS